MTQRDIGLALSGGGARAIAFHLGCLRALNDLDLLQRVRVISGISGGSVLGALWAYGPQTFDEFDSKVCELLSAGLQGAVLKEALRPTALARGALSTLHVLAARGRGLDENPILRTASRTEALARALGTTGLDMDMGAPRTGEFDVVLTATDLRSGGAVRFGSQRSSASRIGLIVDPVPVRDAVAASAAFPLALPALERQYTVQRKGTSRSATLLLADGGIYDNLGLSVFDPHRDPAYTDHVYPVRYVISCDSGTAIPAKDPRFYLSRNTRSFDIIHRRAQDNGRARLHEWASNGALEGFVMSYLAMQDAHLPVPVTDLVPRDAVASYPTSFAPMKIAAIHQLAGRGEQLTRALTAHYLPNLN